MTTSRRIRQRRTALLLGLTVTAGCCLLAASGWFRRLDWFGLDVHFRHCNRLKADGRVVLVDINDHSLSAVSPWPWPRRRHAQLVRTLNDLGAKAVVLDIVFAEPSPTRLDSARVDRYSTVEPEIPILGDPTKDRVIHDDDELAAELSRAGNVYTGMIFHVGPPGFAPRQIVERALRLLQESPRMTFEEFARRVSAPSPWNRERFFGEVRLASMLVKEFGLNVDQLARNLGLESSPSSDGSASSPGPLSIQGDHESEEFVTRAHHEVEQYLAPAKRLAARMLAREYLESVPRGDWSDFFRRVMPSASLEVLSADRNDLMLAFETERSCASVRRTSPVAVDALRDRVAQAYNLTPPIPKIATAARGVGFVVDERHKTGGVLRELPLVVEYDGVLFWQLGFQVATDVLGIDRTRLTARGNHLEFQAANGACRFPLASDGATLLNWHVPNRADHWEESFDHIPVTRVMEIPLQREEIEIERRRLGILRGQLVEARFADTKSEYHRYEGWVNERLDLLASRSRSPSEFAETAELRLRELEQDIEKTESEALDWLKRRWDLWRNEAPVSAAERAEREQVGRLHRVHVEEDPRLRFEKLREKLEERCQLLARELRERVNGRICLVGSTAGAVADLVATPAHGSLPGVMVHANVINMVLQNRPARVAPNWVNLALMGVVGSLLTLITCSRGPLQSCAALIATATLTLIGGGILFLFAGYHVSTIVASVTGGLSWAAVTMIRQLTEERARRHFEHALAQYTSPAIAARIAENSDDSLIAPREARVTCFFADLVGFTGLSERLGPERTRSVLNPYLQEMSGVLVRRHALVNKFIGDGIFAFFNAPLWPCANHSDAACRAALEAQQALQTLNAIKQPRQREERAPLQMRIGLSTGEVYVGDYGSDTKLDYTCIGDTVNLGSRLEKANRVLGTRILVDDSTRQGAGDGYVFRDLGLWFVEGKTIPVRVHELMVQLHQLDEPLREFLDRFHRAMQCFQSCEWGPCEEWLRKSRELRPDDLAAARYLDEVRRLRLSTPDSTWRGALELTPRRI